MDPIIERIYNDTSLNFRIITEINEYLNTKYDEEASFTFACMKNGLNRDQADDLFMLYADITEKISSKDIHLINKELLIEKTKEKFPNLKNDYKIKKIIESFINCYILAK
ncbi:MULTISPECIES: hypothetical protein [unclassified Gemella]|uniref:hypothetical protein n=1 Tax=unclassified Gemella TaxID=2624949 RepID=UPI001C05661E|nr:MULTISPECIES: hypothetical protein [unclassified Gemella]MBU0278626.1 hypothetical protein [Gemella sp. zg-1178]QWQ38251.1 hypothetical protein KMP11_04620 [Gemella sp. zg-570]